MLPVGVVHECGGGCRGYDPEEKKSMDVGSGQAISRLSRAGTGERSPHHSTPAGPTDLGMGRDVSRLDRSLQQGPVVKRPE